MNNITPELKILKAGIQFMTSCTSTNDILTAKFRNNEISEGELLCTFNQTQGRGQRENTWLSEPEKNLAFSFLLQPQHFPVTSAFYFSKAIPVAICNFFKSLTGLQDFEVKWPNDIYFQDKKIGGILIENTVKGDQLKNVLIGVGLNINQERFNLPKAISLKKICQEEYDLKALCMQLLPYLDQSLSNVFNFNFSSVENEYLKQMYRRGEIHKFRNLKNGNLFSAEILGTQQSGELVVRNAESNALEYFGIKEIEYL